jgi:hypothetical protein
MIIGDLIDDLCHHQVECSKSYNQPDEIKSGGQLEASGDIEDIL